MRLREWDGWPDKLIAQKRVRVGGEGRERRKKMWRLKLILRSIKSKI